jgi:hypothetical protein
MMMNNNIAMMASGIDSERFKVRFIVPWQGVFEKDIDTCVNDKYAFKYYDLTNLINNNMFLCNNISLLHINITNIRANFDAFVHLVESLGSCFDVIALTKTWLDDVSSQLFSVKGYMFSFPRDSDWGGGICIYIKVSYVVTPLKNKTLPVCNIFEHAELNIASGFFQSTNYM